MFSQVPPHSHVGQHGVVCGDLGEVVLQDGEGSCQSDVSAAAEERHAGEAQDGGHQRCVRHAAQTFNTALKTTCTHTNTRYSLKSFTQTEQIHILDTHALNTMYTRAVWYTVLGKVTFKSNALQCCVTP